MLRTLVKCFRRNVPRLFADRQAATAVEFALIAPAFLASLLAIIQITLFMFAQQALQNAVVEAGRTFMTGSTQTSGLTQSQFKNVVCPLVSTLFNCDNLQIDVSTYASFSGASTAAPALYDSSCHLITTGPYNPGTQGDIMVVQLVYPWPIFGTPLGFVLPFACGGTTEMMGVTAFRVEPY